MFNVGLSNPSATATEVTLNVASASATLGTDTTTPIQVSTDGGTTWTTVTPDASGNIAVNYPAGATTGVQLRVPTVDDTIYEGTEAINVSAKTATQTTAATATGTINDNDIYQDPNDTATVTEDTTLTKPVGSLLTGATTVSSAIKPVISNVTVDTNGDGTADPITIGTATTLTKPNVSGGTITIGTLTVNADGGYTFVPSTNYDGSVPVVNYDIVDSANGNTKLDSSTLTITITPVNDAPVAVADTATAVEAGGSANGYAGTNPDG